MLAKFIRCPHCGWESLGVGEAPWHCHVCKRDDMVERKRMCGEEAFNRILEAEDDEQAF